MLISTFELGLHWPTLDPFLFCACHDDRFPRGNGEFGPVGSLEGRQIGNDFMTKDGFRMYHGDRIPGFPVHPHRGFETITLVREGYIDHADSMGAAGRYGQGDVQWMTAGKGVQHSEMFPLLNTDADNPVKLFQLWLNLPSYNKLVEPDFTMFWAEAIPKKNSEGVEITLITGNFFGLQGLPAPSASWAKEPDNQVSIVLLELAPGSSINLELTNPEVNRMLYFYEGEKLQVGDKFLSKQNGGKLDFSPVLLHNPAKTLGKVLILQGKPINEPIAQQGPFVMNTRDELVKAFQDYQTNQFGGWPWSMRDQVHGQRGRFAIHKDGHEELAPISC
jgi:redox-sensitive bicupin YhaK (pirin superfamily)